MPAVESGCLNIRHRQMLVVLGILTGLDMRSFTCTVTTDSANSPCVQIRMHRRCRQPKTVVVSPAPSSSRDLRRRRQEAAFRRPGLRFRAREVCRHEHDHTWQSRHFELHQICHSHVLTRISLQLPSHRLSHPTSSHPTQSSVSELESRTDRLRASIL